MKKTVLILVFVLYTSISAADVDEYVHPHYTYICAENRSIIIKGISNGGIVWVETKTQTCVKDQINVTSQQALIEKDCTKHNKNKSEVTLRIWDKLHDRKKQPPFPKTNANINGGRGIHRFKLICDNIPSSGVERTAERQMQLSVAEEKTDQRYEVGSVKMTFRKNSDINSEELTNIYVGGEFYMFLKYDGESYYVVTPTLCTALKGYNVDISRYENAKSGSEKVILWDNSTCLSTISKTYSIMENFTIEENFARAKMYGFHFPDSPYISIVCEVTVCESLSRLGCSNYQHCSTTSTYKKRRKRTLGKVGIDNKQSNVFNQSNIVLQVYKEENKSNGRILRNIVEPKNANLMKVYKSIRVLDIKTSDSKRLDSSPKFIYLMVIALTVVSLN